MIPARSMRKPVASAPAVAKRVVAKCFSLQRRSLVLDDVRLPARAEGTIKVLDLGLAKAMAAPSFVNALPTDSSQGSEHSLDGRHDKSRILSRNRMSRIVRHHEGAMRRCQDPFAQNPQSIT